jgi:hypothetical protein
MFIIIFLVGRHHVQIQAEYPSAPVSLQAGGPVHRQRYAVRFGLGVGAHIRGDRHHPPCQMEWEKLVSAIVYKIIVCVCVRSNIICARSPGILFKMCTWLGMKADFTD